MFHCYKYFYFRFQGKKEEINLYGFSFTPQHVCAAAVRISNNTRNTIHQLLFLRFNLYFYKYFVYNLTEICGKC